MFRNHQFYIHNNYFTNPFCDAPDSFNHFSKNKRNRHLIETGKSFDEFYETDCKHSNPKPMKSGLKNANRAIKTLST